jgi:hypothetical protein
MERMQFKENGKRVWELCVKPHVKPPYRNPNISKTIRKVDVESCYMLQWGDGK